MKIIFEESSTKKCRKKKKTKEKRKISNTRLNIFFNISKRFLLGVVDDLIFDFFNSILI